MKKFAVGLALLGAAASARTYNYQDVPLGERSFGMGNATMAVPGDVSNMFFNPATLAYVESSQVSASLSSYARIDTRTGEFVSLFRSARDNISRGGFLANPSMVGGNIKTGEWMWGGSILVPFYYENSGTVDLNTLDLGSFESKFQSVWMGMFLARRFGNQNFGVSLFYASRQTNEKFFFITRSVTPSQIRFVQNTYAINGVVGVLGGSYDLNEEWHFGYSFRPPPMAFSGDGEYGDNLSGATISVQNTKFKSKFYPLPMRLSVGATWSPRTDLMVAADLHFYSAVKGSPVANNGVFDVDAKPIMNFSLGTEYIPWKGLGFRLGVMSNFSSARYVSKSLSAINDRVNMFGGTAAIVFDKPTGSISLGGYVQAGQGRSNTIADDAIEVPRSNFIYGFVVGSSYKF